MSQTFAADFRLNDFDPALLADDAAVLHALIFAAIALPIFRGAENLGAEKPIAFRLEGPIVDGLGLFDFAMRPFADFRRRRNADADPVEIDRLSGLFEKFQDTVQSRSS